MAGSELSKAAQGKPAQSVDVFDTMRHEMNRLFDRFDQGWPSLPGLLGVGGKGGGMSLSLDVRDEPGAMVIEAELPGVDEKDVSVTLVNGVLTISGEKKSEREEKKDNYYLSERSFGSFRRSLRLPDTIDEAKVEAKFDKGVLHINAPKKPEAAKAERKIEIRGA